MAWDLMESTKLSEREAGEITVKTNEKSKVEKAKENYVCELEGEAFAVRPSKTQIEA